MNRAAWLTRIPEFISFYALPNHARRPHSSVGDYPIDEDKNFYFFSTSKSNTKKNGLMELQIVKKATFVDAIPPR